MNGRCRACPVKQPYLQWLRCTESTSLPAVCSDQQNMSPYCRLAGRLKLTVREATLILQMLEDMDTERSGLLTGEDVYAYFNLDAPELAKRCLLADALLHRERLEYHEMFMSLYNFCTLPPIRLGDYVFQVSELAVMLAVLSPGLASQPRTKA